MENNDEFIDITSDLFINRISKIISSEFYIPKDEVRELIETFIENYNEEVQTYD